MLNSESVILEILLEMALGKLDCEL